MAHDHTQMHSNNINLAARVARDVTKHDCRNLRELMERRLTLESVVNNRKPSDISLCGDATPATAMVDNDLPSFRANALASMFIDATRRNSPAIFTTNLSVRNKFQLRNADSPASTHAGAAPSAPRYRL